MNEKDFTTVQPHNEKQMMDASLSISFVNTIKQPHFVLSSASRVNFNEFNAPLKTLGPVRQQEPDEDDIHSPVDRSRATSWNYEKTEKVNSSNTGESDLAKTKKRRGLSEVCHVKSKYRTAAHEKRWCRDFGKTEKTCEKYVSVYEQLKEARGIIVPGDTGKSIQVNCTTLMNSEKRIRGPNMKTIIQPEVKFQDQRSCQDRLSLFITSASDKVSCDSRSAQSCGADCRISRTRAINHHIQETCNNSALTKPTMPMLQEQAVIEQHADRKSYAPLHVTKTGSKPILRIKSPSPNKPQRTWETASTAHRVFNTAQLAGIEHETEANTSDPINRIKNAKKWLLSQLELSMSQYINHHFSELHSTSTETSHGATSLQEPYTTLENIISSNLLDDNISPLSSPTDIEQYEELLNIFLRVLDARHKTSLNVPSKGRPASCEVGPKSSSSHENKTNFNRTRIRVGTLRSTHNFQKSDQKSKLQIKSSESVNKNVYRSLAIASNPDLNEDNKHNRTSRQKPPDRSPSKQLNISVRKSITKRPSGICENINLANQAEKVKNRISPDRKQMLKTDINADLSVDKAAKKTVVKKHGNASENISEQLNTNKIGLDKKHKQYIYSLRSKSLNKCNASDVHIISNQDKKNSISSDEEMEPFMEMREADDTEQFSDKAVKQFFKFIKCKIDTIRNNLTKEVDSRTSSSTTDVPVSEMSQKFIRKVVEMVKERTVQKSASYNKHVMKFKQIEDTSVKDADNDTSVDSYSEYSDRLDRINKEQPTYHVTWPSHLISDASDTDSDQTLCSSVKNANTQHHVSADTLKGSDLIDRNSNEQPQPHFKSDNIICVSKSVKSLDSELNEDCTLNTPISVSSNEHKDEPNKSAKSMEFVIDTEQVDQSIHLKYTENSFSPCTKQLKSDICNRFIDQHSVIRNIKNTDNSNEWKYDPATQTTCQNGQEHLKKKVIHGISATSVKMKKEEQNVSFPQDTEKLAQDTEKLPQDTEKLAQHTEKLAQHTEKLLQDTEKLAQHTEMLPQDTEKLPQDTEKLPQDTEKLPQDTEKLAQHTEKLAQHTEKLPQDTEKLPQDTEKLAQDTEKLAHDSEMKPCDKNQQLISKQNDNEAQCYHEQHHPKKSIDSAAYNLTNTENSAEKHCEATCKTCFGRNALKVSCSVLQRENNRDFCVLHKNSICGMCQEYSQLKQKLAKSKIIQAVHTNLDNRTISFPIDTLQNLHSQHAGVSKIMLSPAKNNEHSKAVLLSNRFGKRESISAPSKLVQVSPLDAGFNLGFKNVIDGDTFKKSPRRVHFPVAFNTKFNLMREEKLPYLVKRYRLSNCARRRRFMTRRRLIRYVQVRSCDEQCTLFSPRTLLRDQYLDHSLSRVSRRGNSVHACSAGSLLPDVKISGYNFHRQIPHAIVTHTSNKHLFQISNHNSPVKLKSKTTTWNNKSPSHGVNNVVNNGQLHMKDMFVGHTCVIKSPVSVPINPDKNRAGTDDDVGNTRSSITYCHDKNIQDKLCNTSDFHVGNIKRNKVANLSAKEQRYENIKHLCEASAKEQRYENIKHLCEASAKEQRYENIKHSTNLQKTTYTYADEAFNHSQDTIIGRIINQSDNKINDRIINQSDNKINDRIINQSDNKINDRIINQSDHKIIDRIKNQSDHKILDRMTNASDYKVIYNIMKGVMNQSEHKIMMGVTTQYEQKLMQGITNQSEHKLMEGVSNQHEHKLMEGVSNQYEHKLMEGVSNKYEDKSMAGVADHSQHKLMEGITNQSQYKLMEGITNQSQYKLMEGITNQSQYKLMEGITNQSQYKLMEGITNQSQYKSMEGVINTSQHKLMEGVDNQSDNKIMGGVKSQHGSNEEISAEKLNVRNEFEGQEEYNASKHKVFVYPATDVKPEIVSEIHTPEIQATSNLDLKYCSGACSAAETVAETYNSKSKLYSMNRFHIISDTSESEELMSNYKGNVNDKKNCVSKAHTQDPNNFRDNRVDTQPQKSYNCSSTHSDKEAQTEVNFSYYLAFQMDVRKSARNNRKTYSVNYGEDLPLDLSQKGRIHSSQGIVLGEQGASETLVGQATNTVASQDIVSFIPMQKSPLNLSKKSCLEANSLFSVTQQNTCDTRHNTCDTQQNTCDTQQNICNTYYPNSIQTNADKLTINSKLATADLEYEILKSKRADSEKPKSERADSELPKSECADSEVPKSERADSELPKSERADSEVPKSERADSELPKSECADSEVPKSECADSEVPKSECADSEVPKSECADSEVPKSECADSEVPKSECADSDVPKSECADSEVPKSECADSEVPKSECADSEVPKSECANSEVPKSECADSEVSKSECADSDVPKSECADSNVTKSECADSDVPKSECADSDVTKSECADSDVPKSECADSDVPKSECADRNMPKSECADSNVQKSEFADSDVPKSECADSQMPKSECADSDVPKSEGAGTELPKSECANSDVPKSECADSDVPKSECAASEMPKSKCADSDVPKSEYAASEMPKSECADSDVPKSECADSEMPKSECAISEVPRSEQESLKISHDLSTLQTKFPANWCFLRNRNIDAVSINVQCCNATNMQTTCGNAEVATTETKHDLTDVNKLNENFQKWMRDHFLQAIQTSTPSSIISQVLSGKSDTYFVIVHRGGEKALASEINRQRFPNDISKHQGGNLKKLNLNDSHDFMRYEKSPADTLILPIVQKPESKNAHDNHVCCFQDNVRRPHPGLTTHDQEKYEQSVSRLHNCSDMKSSVRSSPIKSIMCNAKTSRSPHKHLGFMYCNTHDERHIDLTRHGITSNQKSCLKYGRNKNSKIDQGDIKQSKFKCSAAEMRYMGTRANCNRDLLSDDLLEHSISDYALDKTANPYCENTELWRPAPGRILHLPWHRPVKEVGVYRSSAEHALYPSRPTSCTFSSPIDDVEIFTDDTTSTDVSNASYFTQDSPRGTLSDVSVFVDVSISESLKALSTSPAENFVSNPDLTYSISRIDSYHSCTSNFSQ